MAEHMFALLMAVNYDKFLLHINGIFIHGNLPSTSHLSNKNVNYNFLGIFIYKLPWNVQ